MRDPKLIVLYGLLLVFYTSLTVMCTYLALLSAFFEHDAWGTVLAGITAFVSAVMTVVRAHNFAEELGRGRD